jgi:hypothetical protein
VETCPNGHPFDSDDQRYCPICGLARSAAGTPGPVTKETAETVLRSSTAQEVPAGTAQPSIGSARRPPRVGGWGWAVFLFGFVGGLIGYFNLKSEDEPRANHVMKWGLIWSLVSILMWIVAPNVIVAAALNHSPSTPSTYTSSIYQSSSPSSSAASSSGGNNSSPAQTARASTTTTMTRPPTTTTALGAGAGTWVAILASIPVDTPNAQIDTQFADATAGIEGAGRLVSTDYSSLRAGYVVAYKGPFADSDAANSYCDSIGRAIPSQCYARLVQR